MHPTRAAAGQHQPQLWAGRLAAHCCVGARAPRLLQHASPPLPNQRPHAACMTMITGVLFLHVHGSFAWLGCWTVCGNWLRVLSAGDCSICS